MCFESADGGQTEGGGTGVVFKQTYVKWVQLGGGVEHSPQLQSKPNEGVKIILLVRLSNQFNWISIRKYMANLLFS